MAPPTRPLAERFEAQLTRLPDLPGCWLWTGAQDRDGYGFIMDETHDQRKAHHVALILQGIPVRPGQMVLHHCDTPQCVRPTHLYQGSNQDNVNDRVRRGRSAGAPRGTKHHDAKLTPEDVYAIRASTGTLKEVAEQYGIFWSYVAQIRARRTWRHLPDLNKETNA